ncbi:MAG: MBL fold metallo-hydrolase [Caldilineaceae bacterium]
MIEEIVRGVFTIEHRVAEGKNAVIFGDRDAWAVDTGSDASEGVRTVDLIRAHGYLPNRLIYTHGHGDHILGSAPFAGADIFAHRLTPVEMRRLLPTLAACRLYGERIRCPTGLANSYLSQ